jgi:hypothetical protein
MIFAIELIEVTPDEGLPHIVYTRKIASFEWEKDAIEFTKDQDNMMLIDDEGEVLKDASIEISKLEK